MASTAASVEKRASPKSKVGSAALLATATPADAIRPPGVCLAPAEASDTELVQNVQNNDARTEFVPALRTMATRQPNKPATRASVFSRAAVHPWPLDPRETTVMTAFTPYQGAY
jgi:hypothetical protein